MKARLPATLAVLLCIPFLALGQEARRVVAESSHTGAVNDLAFDAERGLLLSGGEDGTVRIWDVAAARLKAVFRVSYRPVQRLALHPSLSQVAVLIGENLKTDTVSVWDWEQGRELFSLTSEQQLFHLAYAPQGGYLAYSRADFRSLQAVDPQDGRRLGLFAKGFGIVSFFVISKNENTVMGYQPSGWITYWDARQEEAVLRLRTLADLSTMRIMPSGRHLLASTGDRLVAVDLLNGGLAAEESIASVTRVAVSLNGTEAGALVLEESGYRVRRWAFNGIDLRALASPEVPSGSAQPVSLAYGWEGLFVADKAGSIYSLSAERWASLARNVYLSISGLAFRGDTLAAAARDGIFLYSSGFLAEEPDSGRGLEVRRRVLSNPFARPIGVEFLDDRRLLVWTEDAETGALAVVDPASGEARLLPVAFSAPIQEVSLSPRGLIVVEEGGVCRILDRNNFQESFRYLVPSMNKLVASRGDLLIGGASGASVFGSPLIQINIRSGETVPIADPSQFIYDLLYSGSSGSLYCLAVVEARAGRSTLLLERSGKELQRRQVLDSFAGEDLGASLAEGASGRVYCSLGYRGVVAWDGSRLTVLPPAIGRVARRLAVHGPRLYALNSDFTITLWDQAALGRPWELHLFQNGSWAAVSPEGSLYASEDARMFLAQS